jgi:hypothetical protein
VFTPGLVFTKKDMPLCMLSPALVPAGETIPTALMVTNRHSH